MQPDLVESALQIELSAVERSPFRHGELRVTCRRRKLRRRRGIGMEVVCATIQYQSLLVALLGDGKEPDLTRHISVSEIQHASVEEAADEPVIAPAGTTQPRIHIGMNPTVSGSLDPRRVWQNVL